MILIRERVVFILLGISKPKRTSSIRVVRIIFIIKRGTRNLSILKRIILTLY